MVYERKCKSEFDISSIVLKDIEHCSNIFINKTDIVEIANIPVAFTTRYRLCTKPAGFGLGKHLYSLSLVPGEEVEIAVSHRRKLETKTHQLMSVEQEFTNSFAETFKEEHSQKESSDFKFTAEEKVKGNIFFASAEVKSTQEYSKHEEEYTKTIREAITKATYKVDQKFEVVIDMKSEVESKSAIKRKVKNPNTCYSVNYNYFQLLRKYKAELILTGYRFDLFPLPDIRVMTHGSKPFTVRIAKVSFAAIPVAKTISEIDATKVTTEKSVSPLVTTTGKTVMALDKARFDILVNKAVPEPDLRKFKLELEKFLKRFRIGVVVKRYEYTIATNGIYVDSLIGQCSACENYIEEKHKLEIELMKADIELKKKQLESDENEEIEEDVGE